jgi:hypothetical protein
MMKMADKLTTTGRLLVLVPEDELDESRYARKARALAEVQKLNIRFIGMVRTPEMESLMRRKLVTLSGISGSESAEADFIESGLTSWVEIIQNECGTQDFILCPEEFNLDSFLNNDVCDLRSEMAGKIYMVPGMMPSDRQERLERATRNVLNWAGILAIIAIGFLLEVDFDRQTVGIARTLTEIIIFSAEIGILWWWNTFVSRLNY